MLLSVVVEAVDSKQVSGWWLVVAGPEGPKELSVRPEDAAKVGNNEGEQGSPGACSCGSIDCVTMLFLILLVWALMRGDAQARLTRFMFTVIAPQTVRQQGTILLSGYSSHPNPTPIQTPLRVRVRDRDGDSRCSWHPVLTRP